MKYKVEVNRCNCHPETCCHADWIVVDDDGEEQCSFFSYHRAEAFCIKMNDLFNKCNREYH
jgi:hypothetical protein